ncbi:transposase [Streptomyces mirabilis]|uniref:transposase n=2 Tax=Streptomyces mirabilis TaxID=68239 RepID=UPI0033D3CAF9
MVVDVDSRHPVDVLPDRTSETPVAWLHDHPGVEVMCRDRASAYARPVKEAAPQAIEVADRWHLLRNLTLAVERTCHEHRPCLRKYAERTQRAGPRMPAQEAQPPTLIVDRFVRRHEEISRMVDVGYPLSGIALHFGLDRRAVRRYRDTIFDVLLASARDRRDVPLDRFRPYPQAEFAARNTVVPSLLPARSPGGPCDHMRTSHCEKRTPPSADSHPTVVPTPCRNSPRVARRFVAQPPDFLPLSGVIGRQQRNLST